jgi:hypothetical protein
VLVVVDFQVVGRAEVEEEVGRNYKTLQQKAGNSFGISRFFHYLHFSRWGGTIIT